VFTRAQWDLTFGTHELRDFWHGGKRQWMQGVSKGVGRTRTTRKVKTHGVVDIVMTKRVQNLLRTNLKSPFNLLFSTCISILQNMDDLNPS
jgi:hypothetical protein